MPESVKPKSYFKFILFSLFVFAFFGSYLIYFITSQTKPSLPILGQISYFELTDSTGQPFGLSSLNNKIWISDFIFTTCAGPCPIMTQNMGSLYRSYLLEKDVHFVSFSVNPDYDTPKVLSEYAAGQKADVSRWHFLTGPISAIKQIAVDDFKVGHKEDALFHSAFLILVDKKAQIRGYYDGTNDESVKKLFQDTAKLLKEK